jgi:hypothetical protein
VAITLREPVACFPLFGVLLVAPLAFAACTSEPDPDNSGPAGTGGTTSAGGSSGASSGGMGGTLSSGGNAGNGTGGAGTGGAATGGSGTGGASGLGGSAGATGGSSGSGGNVSAGTGNGGSSGDTATGGSGGAPVTGGASGASGAGGADSGGSGGSAGAAAGSGGAPTTERFSFFMTSQAGLERLSESPDGFGGDLTFGQADGLSGADEICRQLADTSMPGNGKTWRAFLSVTEGPNGMPVDAIDRIGEGPWYDRLGRVVAMTREDVLQVRPRGADPAIVDDLPNEDGVPNHDPGTGIIDNHNVLTGSTTQGTLDNQGLSATCQDWTSSESMGGRPRCGVSWPRASLLNWISVLNEGGCAPGSTPPGANSGPQGTVGALGGYGGFYCFALTP